MGPAEASACARPRPPAARAIQVVDNLNGLPHKERTAVIAASWRAATDPLASPTLLHNLHRVTLLCMLDNEWSRLDKPLLDEVIESIGKCADAIKEAEPLSLDENRLRYLIRTAADPWHHPVLKEIMRGGTPTSQDVLGWLREEGCTGALERLRLLCGTKGAGEGAALRLADALVPLPPLPQTLPANFRCRAFDALLVLLMRANRTSDCIAHIKAMDPRVAYALIGRLASRNKSHGRMWKRAHDTALLCTQVLVATCMVRPIDNQLGALAAKLASFYESRSEELAPALRKLLNSADTANHIYIVCRAVQHQFGETMRSFICELYIRALTTGVNELERQKHQDETGTNTSHQLADWFLSLANLLSPNPIVSAECVLTAFSLHPSKQYYARVKECSVMIKQKSDPVTVQDPALEDENFDRALDGLESSLNQMKVEKSVLGTAAEPSETVEAFKTEKIERDEIVPQSLVSGAVLEGEGLELSRDLCHDLAVLLSGPRLKMLTWDLSWEKLSEYCISYMADTEEGTKTVTTELKYVHLDYSKFEIKEPEIHDIYFGIEKGYEHHLEIEEDDWEEEYEAKPLLPLVNDDYDDSATDSAECLYYDDSGHKRVYKRPRKKAVKKSADGDAKLIPKTDKPKPIKRERKPKEKSDKTAANPRQKKVNPNLPTDNFNNHQSNIHFAKSFINNSAQDSGKPVPSFYRMQMEMHDAHKKKIDHLMFNDYGSVKTENAQHSINPIYSQYSEIGESSKIMDNTYMNTMQSNFNNTKAKSSLLSFRKQPKEPNQSGYSVRYLNNAVPTPPVRNSLMTPQTSSSKYSNYSHSPNYIYSPLPNSLNHNYHRQMPQTETNANRDIRLNPIVDSEKKSTLNELSLLRNKLLILTGHQTAEEQKNKYSYWSEQSPPPRASSVSKHYPNVATSSPENLKRFDAPPQKMYTAKYIPQHSEYDYNKKYSSLNNTPPLIRAPSKKASRVKQSNQQTNLGERGGSSQYVVKTTVKQEYSMSYNSDMSETKINKTCIDSSELLEQLIKDHIPKPTQQNVIQYSDSRHNASDDSKFSVTTASKQPFPREYNKFKSKILSNQCDKKSDNPKMRNSNNTLLRQLLFGNNPSVSSVTKTNQSKSLCEIKSSINQNCETYSIVKSPKKLSEMMDNALQKIYKHTSMNYVKKQHENMETSIKTEPVDIKQEIKNPDIKPSPVESNNFDEPKFPIESVAKTQINQQSDAIYQKFLADVQSAESNISSELHNLKMTENMPLWSSNDYGTNTDSTNVKNENFENNDRMVISPLFDDNAQTELTQSESIFGENYTAYDMDYVASTVEVKSDLPSDDVKSYEQYAKMDESLNNIDNIITKDIIESIIVDTLQNCHNANVNMSNSVNNEKSSENVLSEPSIEDVLPESSVEYVLPEPSVEHVLSESNDVHENLDVKDFSDLSNVQSDVDMNLPELLSEKTHVNDENYSPELENIPINEPESVNNHMNEVNDLPDIANVHENDDNISIETSTDYIDEIKPDEDILINQSPELSPKIESNDITENPIPESASNITDELEVNNSDIASNLIEKFNPIETNVTSNPVSKIISNAGPKRRKRKIMHKPRILKNLRSNRGLICDSKTDLKINSNVNDNIIDLGDVSSEDNFVSKTDDKIIQKESLVMPKELVVKIQRLDVDKYIKSIASPTQDEIDDVVTVEEFDNQESMTDYSPNSLLSDPNTINSIVNKSVSKIKTEDKMMDYSDDDQPIATLIEGDGINRKVNPVKKIIKGSLLQKHRKKSSKISAFKDKTNSIDMNTSTNSEVRVISIDDSSNTDSKQILSPVENDVIDLLSDSDVEIVISNDPIAVDPMEMIPQQNETSTDQKFAPVLPLFFTVIPEIKVAKRGRKPKIPLISDSLIIYHEDASKIIKISKMPQSDCDKFQKSCYVKLQRDDLIQIRNRLFKKKTMPKTIKGKRKNDKNKKMIVGIIRTRSSNSNPSTPSPISEKIDICDSPDDDELEITTDQPTIVDDVTIDLSLDNNDDDNFTLIKVKEENIDKSTDPTQCADDKISDLDNSFNDESVNLLRDVKTIDSKEYDNCDVNKNDLNDEMTEDDTLKNSKTSSDNENDDSFCESVNDELCPIILTNTVIDFEHELDMLNIKNNAQSENINTNQLQKKCNYKSRVRCDLIGKIVEDDALLSNESCVDFISSKNLSSESKKTYKNMYYQNKRKLKFDSDSTTKKICMSSKIDLPEFAQNLDSYQVKIEEKVLYDRVQLMSIQQLLSMENDEDTMDEYDAMDQDMNIDDLPELDFTREENDRDSVYSPIELYVTNDDVKSNNHLNQGKGFGDWSGRGNKKDSSRGSMESPAAVLPDAVTTRPPLALHNHTNTKANDVVSAYMIENLRKVCLNRDEPKPIYPECEIESNNNFPSKKYAKENVMEFNDNFLYRKNWKTKKYNSFDKFNISEKSILSRVPGLNDLEFIRPLPTNAIVRVVQLGQLPVSSAQQNSLSDSSTRSQTSNEFLNSVESPPNEIQSNNIENNDFVENSTENIKTQESETNNKSCDDPPLNDVIPNNEIPFENIPIETNSDPVINTDLEKSVDMTQSTSEENFSEDQKDSNIENHIGIIPTSTHNFIATSRGQALVNLLSQKIMHSPAGGQHLQMTTFPKGATINALSLQQALAQILPPPLSQSSSESVIHSASHSTQVGTSQVVHIVQGKSTTQTSTGTFQNLLVDNTQSSVISNTGTTQVLHIVQGKHSNSNNSGILNQSQFSGLSLVDAGVQQSGNQVLHIVNTGVQSKNNTTAQVLKRVNLLTSITNSQGNNEQKMVQFVCKAPDGKSLQLNTQPQRGMVLRLQPIENSTFTKVSETTTSIVNTSVHSTVLKTTTDQSQQELKSRSVYEENYAKFIQNSSQVVPSSPEKSISLPKFNQAFGKSAYQDNNSIPKPNENLDTVQNTTIANDQDLTTLNLGQLGHIANPPLLIRKAPQSNILHQNVMQQVKQSIAPMNIQTIHGGVIYTRQIPVNIGGGQTINLITVPSSDLMDEVQLQSIQKQNQEKSTEQLEPNVIKLVSNQEQANNSICHLDTTSDDSNQIEVQNNVNNHPLLTQMRIKVPMLSKGGGQVVTGARVVRPMLQIQRNLIPGSNPAVYQQLVLTTAPSVRQSVPTTTTAVRPARPPTTHQESNLSSSTLEQLREFDMVLEQVKERSTVQPGNNSNSNFSDTSPQCQTTESTELDSPQPSTQREVLYSIGPNQSINVTYVNQKVIAKTPSTSYGSTESIANLSQNSPSPQITHGLTNATTHTKPCPNTSKASSKSMKSKPSKPANPSNSANTSKASPVAAKTSLQKPLEDEQTTQRILYILAEYKEQVENSPDKDKPAPRRRSNPPTNPTTSSKRKKGSGGSSKKSGSGQSLQEMSPLGDDAGHTMGSEDSSCGLSQGECTDNSIQGTENPSPQSSPQKSAKKILFQETESPAPVAQQQRNVLIADGQAITMTRPGTGKATAVLMPANYLLPMSMVKGGQQITIVTNQGPKILSVPQGESGTTNALFLQRLIGPAGLKPMLTRPGQVRHVRLPANTVQSLQAFNLNSSNINSGETSWPSSSTATQPKLLLEYNNTNTDANSETNTDANSESIKEPSSSTTTGDNLLNIKLENTIETSNDVSASLTENILMDQAQNSIHDSTVSELPSFQLPKTTTSNTLNLIQVHSLNPECGKLYSVQNSSGITSLIQLSGKSTLAQHQENINRLNEDNTDAAMDIQDSAVSQFDTHYLNTKKVIITHDNKLELAKDGNVMDSSMPVVDGINNQHTFILSHGVQKTEGDTLNSNQREDNHTWSGNDTVATPHGNGSSPSFVNFENSPNTQRDEQAQADVQDSVGMRDLAAEGNTRVLRHPYSPSTSPSGPRHLYHKMFITTPVKKSFNADLVEHSTSSTEEDKQYIQRPLKKKITPPSTQTVTFHNNSTSYTIQHPQNPQVVSICHPDRKATESMDVSSDVSVGRGTINQSAVATHHSVASLRHKYAVMEHELRLQKSLSEECEDLGVDSPSASDLFPEAELLFAASPSSQFDQSQDGCALASSSHISTSTTHGSSGHQLSTSSSLSSTIKDTRISDVSTIDPAEESEFARMHPNTTFHSGEIELVGDDPEDPSVNISFRGSSIKHSQAILSKRGDVVRSVIEGIGNSGSSTIYPPTKITPNFSMVDLPRRTLNAMAAIQSSDDYSEGADDSMNSAESKDCLVNNKSLDGILSTNEIVKRDLSLASTESPITISSNIIQRNITQVIRHASSDQLSLPSTDDVEKLHNDNLSELSQNGNFLLDGSNDAGPAADSSILKSIMLERDGRDALTCSSPEQHSELFWESNSNSNQSEEQMPPAPPNLLDFSSEDSNKCCKSPLSCEETNSTDSSSLGGLNSQTHNSHPLRINSVIKSSASNSGAAEGPILHSALLSNNPNIISQDISKKMNSVHKSDSNTSSSPDASNRTNLRKSWSRGIKGSGRRRVLSPQSLSTEINMGAEIETSSSEGVSIFTKPSGGSVLHSGSSTPEETGGVNRRVSLRGPGGVKRSCHCCGGVPTAVAPAGTSSSSRRARRKPASLH